jgi:ATP-dependent DNA helicase RecQ
MVDAELAHKAASFLKQAEMPIQPKVQVAANAFIEYSFRGNLPQNIRAQEGRVLSRWGDAGWGRNVANSKHSNHFGDDLVNALADMIKRWQPNPIPTWVCCVPSRKHPNLVPDFAARLAKVLELPIANVVRKVRENAPQKLQQNRFYQCHNLDGAFSIEKPVPNGPVFLIDDIIDSGWTLTVIAALLQQNGSGPVFPVSLASTSVSDT